MRRTFTLLEVTVALALFVLTALEMLWLFQWGHHSIKGSQERTRAYTLAMRKLEDAEGGCNRAAYNCDNYAANYDNYYVAIGTSNSLWDQLHGARTGEPNGFINFPANNTYDEEFDYPGFSNAANSAYLDASVRWTDYLGASQKIRIGTIKQTRTVLLLHCNQNEPATFYDFSPPHHTVTVNGGAQVSTTQSKFGGASAYFDGSGDYLSIPDSADWQMGSGDFTIDFWTRLNTVGAYRTFIAYGGEDGATSYIVRLNADNTLTAIGVSFVTLTSSSTYTTNTWYHIAFVRYGNIWTLYVNGTSVATNTVSGTIATPFSPSLFIGRHHTGIYNSAPDYMDGYIDEVRVSKGIARWTANFIPPLGEH